ncbi:MAG: enoyl-CoA hydratase, partial [Trebonia sp.]
MPGIQTNIDLDTRVATVTLDEPERRNAISCELADKIRETFDALETDERVGAVVVTGAPPAFCAGAVLGDLAKADEHSLRRVYAAFLKVRDSSLPTVAAVNGPAVGAGLNLALACDLRICGTSALFDARFLDIGLHPGGGATWMLQRQLGEAAATAMLLFGQSIDGPAAARIGLAWSCVDDGELLAAAGQIAARAARPPRELAREMKRTLRRVERMTSHADALELELDRQLWSAAKPWFS